MKNLIVFVMTIFLSLNCFAQDSKAKQTVEEYLDALNTGKRELQSSFFADKIERYYGLKDTDKATVHDKLVKWTKPTTVKPIGKITIKADKDGYIVVFYFRLNDNKNYYKRIKLNFDYKIYYMRDFEDKEEDRTKALLNLKD